MMITAKQRKHLWTEVHCEGCRRNDIKAPVRSTFGRKRTHRETGATRQPDLYYFGSAFIGDVEQVSRPLSFKGT